MQPSAPIKITNFATLTAEYVRWAANQETLEIHNGESWMPANARDYFVSSPNPCQGSRVPYVALALERPNTRFDPPPAREPTQICPNLHHLASVPDLEKPGAMVTVKQLRDRHAGRRLIPDPERPGTLGQRSTVKATLSHKRFAKARGYASYGSRLVMADSGKPAPPGSVRNVDGVICYNTYHGQQQRKMKYTRP